jgi:hypothetical protein
LLMLRMRLISLDWEINDWILVVWLHRHFQVASAVFDPVSKVAEHHEGKDSKQSSCSKGYAPRDHPPFAWAFG